jgi:hypothetical protein
MKLSINTTEPPKWLNPTIHTGSTHVQPIMDQTKLVPEERAQHLPELDHLALTGSR